MILWWESDGLKSWCRRGDKANGFDDFLPDTHRATETFSVKQDSCEGVVTLLAAELEDSRESSLEKETAWYGSCDSSPQRFVGHVDGSETRRGMDGSEKDSKGQVRSARLPVQQIAVVNGKFEDDLNELCR